MPGDKVKMERTLEFMRAHDGITYWDAVFYLGVWEFLDLPRIIKKLREQGYNIEMTWQRRPNGEKFGLYRLVD